MPHGNYYDVNGHLRVDSAKTNSVRIYLIFLALSIILIIYGPLEFLFLIFPNAIIGPLVLRFAAERQNSLVFTAKQLILKNGYRFWEVTKSVPYSSISFVLIETKRRYFSIRLNGTDEYGVKIKSKDAIDEIASKFEALEINVKVVKMGRITWLSKNANPSSAENTLDMSRAKKGRAKQSGKGYVKSNVNSTDKNNGLHTTSIDILRPRTLGIFDAVYISFMNMFLFYLYYEKGGNGSLLFGHMLLCWFTYILIKGRKHILCLDTHKQTLTCDNKWSMYMPTIIPLKDIADVEFVKPYRSPPTIIVYRHFPMRRKAFGVDLPEEEVRKFAQRMHEALPIE